MNNRIKILRKDALKMTQKAFAEALGFSENFIWQIEKGDRVPSDRTISDICRVFNVNRRYLEQGEEPMFLPELDPDTDFINTLLDNSASPFVDVIRKILRAYVELPLEDQKKFDSFVDSLRENNTQKDRD